MWNTGSAPLVSLRNSGMTLEGKTVIVWVALAARIIVLRMISSNLVSTLVRKKPTTSVSR